MVVKYSSSNPDILAKRLLNLAQVGQGLAPAWDGGNISVPICSPDGRYGGRVLPGTGVYIPVDLKELGITRTLPGVYDYSRTQRRIDFASLNQEYAERHAIALLDARVQMQRTSLGPRPIAGGVITTYDGIIAARAGGLANDVMTIKNSITTVANIWYNLWQPAGNPQAGAYTAITGGAAPTNATAGAWSQGLSNPTGGKKKYLLTLGFGSTNSINMMLLYDMLVAAGNIITNSNTNQTVNTTALTRYTTGIGVNMIFDVVTAPASGTQNLTVNSYTNTVPTTARTTVAHVFSAAEVIPLYRLSPKFPTVAASVVAMQLAAGDIGVKSVETIVFSAAVATGIVAVILYFPLCFIPGISTNVYVERDSTVQIDGLTELAQTSGAVMGCLCAFVNAFTTTSGAVTSFLRTAEG